MSSFATTLWEVLRADLPLIHPQLLILFAATIMLWPGDALLGRNDKGRWAPVTVIVLLVAGILVWHGETASGFSGMYVVDGVTKGFQGIVLAAACATVLLSQRTLDSLKEQTVEYYALLLFSVAGMLFLVGATDFVSLYFSLELMAICIYILVAHLRTHERSIEAGMKYFLLGAFSSGILLYGISLLFGAAGGAITNLAAMGQLLAVTPASNSLLVFAGVLLVLVGFCFKVAAVPFHMWSPDAYEGAPTPVTAFMSMAPKAASLAAFLRVFGASGLGNLRADWALPLAFVAGASMVVGNVAALRQQSMKRLLAYSSIAHVGYMLLGVLAPDPAGGFQAVWLYMLTYVLMQTGAFAVVIHLQGKGEGERIDDFRGLARRRPVLAFAMMVFLLSLAGIPPLVGFFSKFYLFKLAIEQGYVGLTVLALLTSAMAAYYYLSVVAQMYFKEPSGADVPVPGAALSFVVAVSCALILLGTFMGNGLLNLAARILPSI